MKFFRTNRNKTQNLEETRPVSKRPLTRKVINAFLYLFVFVFSLIAIIFVVSQTSIFKEFLRKELITIINDELNGKINIGKIEGTIFSSLRIYNTTLTFRSDTVAHIDKIALETSPLQILFKRIYVRNLSLNGVKGNLLHDSLNNWNISEIAKPSKKKKDTTKSSFPFLIIVNKLEINNLCLRVADYKLKKVNRHEDSLTLDNLNIKKMYLSASAFANIDSNEFRLNVSNISLEPNFGPLVYLKTSFQAGINNHQVFLRNFKFNTHNTDISLGVDVDKANLFNLKKIKELETCPLRLLVDINKFSTKDLSCIVPAMRFLNADIGLNLDAKGTLENFNVDKLSLKTKNTQIDLNGKIQNVLDVSHLKYGLNIASIKLVESDIKAIMPTTSVPVYDLGIVDIKGRVDGTLYKISTDIDLKSRIGNVLLKGYLNFSKDSNDYNFDMKINDLDLNPVINKSSKINLLAKLKGKGLDPYKLNTDAQIVVYKTYFDKYKTDTSEITLSAYNGKYDLRGECDLNDAKFYINGNVNLSKHVQPTYSLETNVYRLNLMKFVNDSSLNTNLNFNLNFDGKSFDIDSLLANAHLIIRTSQFQKRFLPYINISAKVLSPFNKYKILQIRSDVFDADISSNQGFSKAILLFGPRIKEIQYLVMEKMKKFSSSMIKDTASIDTLSIQNTIKNNTYGDYEFSYSIRFNDLNKAAKFFTPNKLYCDGEISGIVCNSSAGFKIDTKLDIERFEVKDDLETFLLISNAKGYWNVGKKNGAMNFNNLNTDFDLNIEKIWASTDIKDFSLGFGLNNNNFGFRTNVVYDTLVNLKTIGNVDMKADSLYNIAFDTLNITYNKYLWKLEKPILAMVKKNQLELKQFWLGRDKTKLQFVGNVVDSSIYFSANLPSTPIGDLIKFGYSGSEKLPEIKGLINTTFSIDGFLQDPVISLEVGVKDLQYGISKFGSLDCRLDYEKKNLNYGLTFLDTSLNANKPILDIVGNYPINMALVGVKERAIEDSIKLAIRSKDFDIQTLGPMMPFIKNPRGFFNANILGYGKNIKSMKFKGSMDVSNANFNLIYNNLNYDFRTKIDFNEEIIDVRNISLSNRDKLPTKGNLNVDGKIDFTGMQFNNVDMNLTGDLAILGAQSKSVNQGLYGPVFLYVKDKLHLYFSPQKAEVLGEIGLKGTDLTFMMQEGGYQTSENNEISFEIINKDTTKQVVKKTLLSRNLIARAKKTENIAPKKLSNSKLDMNFGVKLTLDDDCKMTFVLPPVEANQQLTASLSGNLNYKYLNGQNVVQGKLTLGDDSKLSYFFKEFMASGNIIFESDVTNPRLDVEAMYSNELVKENNTTEPVAVIIKLAGYAKTLGRTFAQSNDNIKVYTGQSNIDKRIADQDKDFNDALTFILLNKFKMTTLDKNTILGQGSFATKAGGMAIGTALTSFGNEFFGDAVKNIDYKNDDVNDQQKVSISGKLGKFNYTIGSDTQQWNDLSKADIKIEYNVLTDLFLRLEQKRNTNLSLGKEEQKQEIGLRYRYEF